MKTLRGQWARRAVTLVVAGVVALAPAQAFADRFTISGTIEDINPEEILWIITTSDVIGKPQAITVDVSYFTGLLKTQALGSPISIEIESRKHDTFLMVGFVSEGSYVDRDDTQFSKFNDSIKAHVGNGPEDDEARAQQHRDGKLRKRGGDDNKDVP